MKYKEYAQNFNESKNTEKVIVWIDTILTKHLRSNPEIQDEIEHIIDFLSQTTKDIKGMSYEHAKENTEAWSTAQQKKGRGIKETEKDTEMVLDFKDGFKIVKLIGENAYKREGAIMGHCVASYFGKGKNIYSLRDKNNIPHCTMEEGQQVKGRGNGDVVGKYVEYVVKFLEHIGMTVGDNEMVHLGYVNMEKFKKELHKDTKYFNGKYLPKTEKFIAKNGSEFASFDLWDVLPLVSETLNGLKINFELPTFIKLSFEYMTSKTKKFLSEGSITNKNYAKNASSGDYAKNASSGDYATNASSGDSATNASSGDSAKNASSGDSATNASSGDSATNASSGDSATNASSGDYAKNASSGDYATNASSGYSATNASSGHSATNASSGHSAKNASSGDSATNAMEGKYSVSVDAGHNGKAKGKIGCWFCLSEWKQDVDGIWKPICVKAVQIDGKKIKEDVWYILKNGKIVEVK